MEEQNAEQLKYYKEECDVIKRLACDALGCKQLLLELLNKISMQYKNPLLTPKLETFRDGIKTDNEYIIQGIFLFVLCVEPSMEQMIRTYYKDSSVYDQEFVDLFFKSLKIKTDELQKMPFNSKNSLEYLKQYSEMFLLPWVTEDKYALKKLIIK